MNAGPRECLYCHWYITGHIPPKAKEREAYRQGFCNWYCMAAYDKEKNWAIREAIDGDGHNPS